MSSQGGQDPKISDPMAPCSVKMLNELHTILKGVHGLVSYTFHIPGLYPWWLGIAESEYPFGKKMERSQATRQAWDARALQDVVVPSHPFHLCLKCAAF